MIVTSTAKRYASALFELAREKKCLNEILDEFKKFIALVEQEKNLQMLLKLPNVTRREQILINYLKEKYSELFFNFLLLALKNNRYFLLKQILENYQSRLDKFNNRIRAEVVTAIPLTEQTSSDLIQQLKDYYQADVRIENIIDPSILGGIIIRINGQVFNASVLEKFNKMKLYLTNK